MSRVPVLCMMVVAALSATALLCAGSASATALCSTNTSPCSGTEYGAETHLEASLVGETEATLETAIGTIACPEATLEGATADAGGEEEVVDGTVTGLSFGGGCELPLSGSCSVEAAGLPYPLEISAAEEGGDSVFVGYETGIEVVAHCGLTTCAYVAEESEFALTGGSPAIVVATEIPFIGVSESPCPESALFSAEFEVTEPGSLFAVGDGIWIRSNPGNLDFGQVKAKSSKDIAVTIRYVGGKPTYLLPLFPEMFIGSKGEFIVSFENCKKPTEFPQGHECSATVRFKPETAEYKEAEIAIDEDSGSPRHTGIRAWGEGVK